MRGGPRRARNCRRCRPPGSAPRTRTCTRYGPRRAPCRSPSTNSRRSVRAAPNDDAPAHNRRSRSRRTPRSRCPADWPGRRPHLRALPTPVRGASAAAGPCSALPWPKPRRTARRRHRPRCPGNWPARHASAPAYPPPHCRIAIHPSDRRGSDPRYPRRGTGATTAHRDRWRPPATCTRSRQSRSALRVWPPGWRHVPAHA